MSIFQRLFSLPATTLVVIMSLIMQPVLAHQEMSNMNDRHQHSNGGTNGEHRLVHSNEMGHSTMASIVENAPSRQCMQAEISSHHHSQAPNHSLCTTASDSFNASQQDSTACCDAMKMLDSCCNITHCQSSLFITASLPAISHAQTSRARIIHTLSSPIKSTDNLFRPPIV
ncbi:hypothetical protein [Photobacterium sanguinicancri]|uniref:hypothetical protein n=1 Tax=Photobacterium sanguinicancri TaxID=875932 RepID=UPI003D13BC30